jgi:hypothetical protein
MAQNQIEAKLKLAGIRLTRHREVRDAGGAHAEPKERFEGALIPRMESRLMEEVS